MTAEETEMALSSLAQVVDLLFMKERFAFLLKVKQNWLPILTAAALVRSWCDTTSESFSLKKSPISFLFNSSQDTSYQAPSLFQSAKVLHSIISSSTISLSQEDAVLFTTFLSPNLSSNTKIPSSDQFCDAVTAVLQECDSQQDILGPFLFLQQSSSVSRAMAVVDIVKQEPVDHSKKPAYQSGSDTPDISSEGKN